MTITGDGAATNSSRVLGASSRTSLQSLNGAGIDSSLQSARGDVSDQGQYKDLAIDSMATAIRSLASITDGTATTKTVSAVQRIERVSAGDKRPIMGPGIQLQAVGPGPRIFAPVVSGNRVTGAVVNGLELLTSGSGTGTVTPNITGNTISQSGFMGLSLSSLGPTAPLGFTVAKNSIDRSLLHGMTIAAASPGLVQGNKVADSGFMAAGLLWQTANGGQVRGNKLTGSGYGLLLVACPKEPTVNYNAFSEGVGPGNFVSNMWSDEPTAGATNAENNWWGYTRSEDISRTITEVMTETAVDYSPWLTTYAPRLTALSAAKIGTKVKFTLTFDRPMDTSIRTLRFGKTAPYATYAATGTWNWTGTKWTGIRSRIGLPVGKKMYFSGARDLPGTLMLSTSKYFKL